MKKVSTLALSLLMTYAFMLGSGKVLAQDGTRDTSFRIPFSGWFGQPWNGGGNTQVARQPDGKLLMTGNLSPSVPSNHKNSWLVRFNTDGSLDKAFDDNLPASMSGTRGTGVTVQDDGKIIFCTHSDLQRLNSNGTLDNSYTPDATVKTNIFGSLHLQKDQKLIIGGRAVAPRVVRLNTNGSIDSTFSADFNNTVSEALPLPDGRIIVGGMFTQCNGQNTGSLVILKSDGSLDPSFDVSGGGFKGSIKTVTLDDNGDIMVGGFKFQSFNGTTLTNSAIARISMKGVLDAGFNSAAGAGPVGYWGNADYSAPTISAIITASDSTMVCVGDFLQYNTNSHAYGIVKLNYDGTFDPSFVTKGFATAGDPFGTTAGGSTHRYAAGGLLESDTSIIVIGTFSGYNGDGTAFNMIRIKNTVKSIPPPAPLAITHLSPSPDYCVGDKVAVSYETNGITFSNKSRVWVQLSDANGSYNGNNKIGYVDVDSTNHSGVIKVTIPANIPAGSNYHLRIVGNYPNVIGDTIGSFTIHSLPDVKATAKPDELCEGGSTLLMGSGATSYTWDHGVTDGTSFKPSSTETYTVTGTDANGCSNTAKIVVTVHPLPNVVASARPAKVCPGGETSLIGGGAKTYTWDHGVTDRTPFKPTATTTYTVTGTDAYGCSNQDRVTVTSLPAPGVTAGAKPSASICEGDAVTLIGSGAVTYQWNNPALTFIPGATKTYTVTGTDANGCTAQDQITITVNPLPKVTATASPDAVCAGDETTLRGGGAKSYTWNQGATDNKSFAPRNTQTYTVTGTDAHGCVGTASIAVKVRDLPNVTANARPAVVCDGTATVLFGGGASSYSWDQGVTNGQSITPSRSQTYTVTGTDGFGCSNTADVTVTVNALPNVSITADPGTTICAGSSVSLSGKGAKGYQWYFPGVKDGRSFTPKATQTYLVQGTDVNGCVDTATITVTVNESPRTVVTDTICSGDAYTLGSQTLTTSGTYTEVFPAASGCDSTVILNLTVNKADVVVLRNKPYKLTAQASSNTATYQWINCEDKSAVEGATDRSFVAASGSYAVVVTMFGCTDTSDCYSLSGSTGIDDLGFSRAITLYPNPNRGKMTVHCDEGLTDASMSIINIVGQQVMQQAHLFGNSFQLDISSYASGVYYLEIRQGERVAHIKFTKE